MRLQSRSAGTSFAKVLVTADWKIPKRKRERMKERHYVGRRCLISRITFRAGIQTDL